MRAIGFYLTAKTKNAAWLALVFALLPFIGLPTAWISELIIALVTLRFGARAGLIVIAWAALPALALTYWGDTGPFINMVLFRCFVVWLLAVIFHQYRSWSYVLQAAALIGVIGVLASHFIWSDLQNWWINRLVEFFKQMPANWLPSQKNVNFQTLAQNLSQYATGLFAASVLITNLTLLLLARAWYAMLFSPGSMRREFLQIRMGYLPGLVLVVGLGLMLLGLDWTRDLFAVLLLPFAFAGLSLVHAMANSKKQKTTILAVFYIGLLLLLPYSFVLLSAAGWIDSWYNFRSRGYRWLGGQQKA